MRSGIRLALVGLMFALSGYLLGLFTAWLLISQPRVQSMTAVLNPAQTQRPIALLEEVWDLVETDFIGQLPDSRTLIYGAIRGMLSTLNDPYTSFYEPRLHQREMEDLQGRFGGVGVTMRRNDAGQVVLSPTENGPARQAGVKEEDILIAVDSKPITPSVSFDDIAALVRGPVGTPVTLDVGRGRPVISYTFVITRQEIELPSVAWRLLDDHPDIGYIALSRFSDRSNDELVRAVEALRGKGAQRLVLDLRNNGGGLRQAGIKVASQFLTKGVVMYQHQKSGGEEPFAVIEGGVASDVPLVILVNGGTASAAEIVAGALQDQGRASLVGERTFGKGSVQHIYDLSDGSSLHITTAEWLTPGHRQLTGKGLTPDVLIALTPEDVGAGLDPQLDAAVQVLEQSGVSEKK